MAWKPHKAFLFVDDLLRARAQEMFALGVLFSCAIAAPMCCKKAQFQDRLAWCGINFSHESIQLVSSKLAKFASWIKALLSQKQVLRKTLEQRVGLLIWATSFALHLRSWLAPLSADLNPDSMHSTPFSEGGVCGRLLLAQHFPGFAWKHLRGDFQATREEEARGFWVCGVCGFGGLFGFKLGACLKDQSPATSPLQGS